MSTDTTIPVKPATIHRFVKRLSRFAFLRGNRSAFKDAVEPTLRLLTKLRCLKCSPPAFFIYALLLTTTAGTLLPHSNWALAMSIHFCDWRDDLYRLDQNEQSQLLINGPYLVRKISKICIVVAYGQIHQALAAALAPVLSFLSRKNDSQ